MYSKEKIADIVKNAIYEVTKIRIDNDDINLLSEELKIFPADFLYVFEIIERNIEVSIGSIFVDYGYEAFEVKRFIKIICELYYSSNKTE